jgi:hypothetical protein
VTGNHEGAEDLWAKTRLLATFHAEVFNSQLLHPHHAKITMNYETASKIKA